jgi:nucleoid-associated protein YgaU
MAGYGRRAAGRPKKLVSRLQRRRQATNEGLDRASTPSRRVAVAAGYVMGAVAHLPEDRARDASDTAVNWLLEFGDRILGGGGDRRDDHRG